MKRPVFIITIDTEGDDVWSGRQASTRNAEYLPRFQQLCEQFGLRPVYLTNYEMAQSNTFQSFAQDVIIRNTGEIGMHLHAWNTPPLNDMFPSNDLPYLIEYPEKIIRHKIDYMTKLLQDVFQMPMTSHRSGRWTLNNLYLQILMEVGYQVDCSVTPGLSWQHVKGLNNGKGGSDYTHSPAEPHFIPGHTSAPTTDSSLLEVPVTIMDNPSLVRYLPGCILPKRFRHLRRKKIWLRARPGNRQQMLYILNQGIREERVCLEFALHSSELMPGGSPNFPTASSIEKLYTDLTALFERVQQTCTPATLKEFNDDLRQRNIS